MAVLVLLVTYMRGGSSFLGDLFNHHENVMYYFEPIGSVYSALYGSSSGWLPMMISNHRNGSRREYPELEKSAILNTLRDIHQCNFEELYPETLLSGFQTEFGVRKFLDFTVCARRHLPANAAISEVNLMSRCKKMLLKTCPNTLDTHDHQYCNSLIEQFRLRSEMSVQTGNGVTEKSEYLPVPLRIFEEHQSCIDNATQAISLCSPFITQKCQNSSTTVVKTIRLTMDLVEDILRMIPNTKVIHYVRDPRGIIMSRKQTHLNRYLQPRTESEVLCQKMLRNSLIFDKLRRFHQDRFLEVRYEDLADKPRTVAGEIIRFAGLDMTSQVENALDAMVAGNSNGPAYNTIRKNSSFTASKWKKTISPLLKKSIDDVCQEVYTRFNY